MNDPVESIADAPELIAPGSRVLFILLRAMGDVLLATPAIQAFKKAFPTSQLDVLVERIPSQPLRNNPDIHQIIISPNRGSKAHGYLPVIRQLRRNRYDTVVDFQSTPGSALLARLTKAPTRIGFNRRMRSWAFTHPVTPEESPGYAPLPKFKLLENFGIAVPSLSDSEASLPRLYPDANCHKLADDFLVNAGIDQTSRIVGLAPYCRRDWRMWSVSNWCDLILESAKHSKTTWLLFAGPDEREVLRDLENLQGVRVIWVGMKDLLPAAAVMQKCQAVVTGENGLLHLAVAAGVPTFSIFCGRDAPGQWVPLEEGKHEAVDLRKAGRTQGSPVRELEQFWGSFE